MAKAQATMDFVVTYGWAVFLVFAIIGILAFFGVLSPEKFASEECYFMQPGFRCISHKIDPGAVSLSLQNEKGMDIKVDRVKVGDCLSDFSESLLTGQKGHFSITCSTGPAKSKFKGEIEITYTETESGFTKKIFGILKARIE